MKARRKGACHTCPLSISPASSRAATRRCGTSPPTPHGVSRPGCCRRRPVTRLRISARVGRKASSRRSLTSGVRRMPRNPTPPKRAVEGLAPVGPAAQPGLPVAPVAGRPGTPSSRTADPVKRRAGAGTPEERPRVPAQTPAGGVGASPAPSAGLQTLAAAMSEAQLEEHVRELCKGLGITPGVPDDILIGPQGVMWRELKTMRGKVTRAQQLLGEALLAAGQDWGVWRPGDLLSWRIARELVELSGRPLGI